MFSSVNNQKGFSLGVIIGLVVLAIIIIVSLFLLNSGTISNQTDININKFASNEQDDIRELVGDPVRVTQVPAKVTKTDRLHVAWQVRPESAQAISHTAIHWDIVSHSGDFGFEKTVAESGYANITPEYASGTFNVPAEFATDISIPIFAEFVYLRAHAIIDDQNYWTDEQVIEVIETSGSESQTNDINRNFSGQTVTVSYKEDGFAPREVYIKPGDTIRFLNSSRQEFWPATDTHPTHQLYPGSDSKLCSSSPASIFDACHPLIPGAVFSFTFTEDGDWGYHNHLKAGLGGVVHVQSP